MPKYHLRNKNLANVKKPGSGKNIKQCSCVNHKEWSSNEIYQLVNVKKSTKIIKNVIKKMQNIIYCRSFQMCCSLQICCVRCVIHSTKKVSKLFIQAL